MEWNLPNFDALQQNLVHCKNHPGCYKAAGHQESSRGLKPVEDLPLLKFDLIIVQAAVNLERLWNILALDASAILYNKFESCLQDLDRKRPMSASAESANDLSEMRTFSLGQTLSSAFRTKPSWPSRPRARLRSSDLLSSLKFAFIKVSTSPRVIRPNRVALGSFSCWKRLTEFS